MSALGTEFKINVSADPIDGIHMAEYDFECTLYVYSNKSVTYKKGDEKRIKETDRDNYRIIVPAEDSVKLGKGEVMLKFTAHIPDSDFEDGFRTEVVDRICTGETIT